MDPASTVFGLDLDCLPMLNINWPNDRKDYFDLIAIWEKIYALG